MNHNLLEKVPVILEPHLTLPNGARASRCQRIKKNGSQCANPSRSGFSICSKHGAGYAAREKTEDAKPTGRPPIHGLYSKTGITNIHQLADEVQALNLNLDDTDYELRTLKATLWYLLEQGPKFARHADTFEQLAEQLERKAAGEAGPMDPAEARMIAQTVQQLYRVSTSLGSWTDRVTDGDQRAGRLHRQHYDGSQFATPLDGRSHGLVQERPAPLEQPPPQVVARGNGCLCEPPQRLQLLRRASLRRTQTPFEE